MRELNGLIGRILVGALVLGVALSQWLAAASALAEEREARQTLQEQVTHLSQQLAEAQRQNETLATQLGEAQRAHEALTAELVETRSQWDAAERSNALLRGLLARSLYANLQLQDRLTSLARPASPAGPAATPEDDPVVPEPLQGLLAAGGVGATVLGLTALSAVRRRK